MKKIIAILFLFTFNSCQKEANSILQSHPWILRAGALDDNNNDIYDDPIVTHLIKTDPFDTLFFSASGKCRISIPYPHADAPYEEKIYDYEFNNNKDLLLKSNDTIKFQVIEVSDEKLIIRTNKYGHFGPFIIFENK